MRKEKKLLSTEKLYHQNGKRLYVRKHINIHIEIDMRKKVEEEEEQYSVRYV